jgi:hypothetical protein
MKTIFDAEFATYLLRAKEKMATPDDHVNPLSQVIVAGEAGGKGVKRSRKNDTASTSNKAPKLGNDSAPDGGVNEGELQDQLPPPIAKGGRSTRSRAATFVKPTVVQDHTVDSAAVEGEGSKGDSPPAWGEDFDPITFVAENLKGYSTRLEAMNLEELRKLAVGSGLKCLALNQMVFNRQEKEAAERLEKEVGVAKEELEKELADQLANCQASFNKSLENEKKRVSTLRRSKRNLTTARNAMIVALVKIWKDAGKRNDDISQLQSVADRLDGDLKELEDENDALKEQMASKYVEGFKAAMEQVRALFPNLDGEALAQIDFLKKVEDGKLVSRLPLSQRGRPLSLQSQKP